LEKSKNGKDSVNDFDMDGFSKSLDAKQNGKNYCKITFPFCIKQNVFQHAISIQLFQVKGWKRKLPGQLNNNLKVIMVNQQI
jgi:hypothetical protein